MRKKLCDRWFRMTKCNPMVAVMSPRDIQWTEENFPKIFNYIDLVWFKYYNLVDVHKEIEKYFFRRNYGLEGEARKKAPWVFKLVVFFLAETKTKEIKISNEHIGFVWLPIKEAIKKTTFKNSKKLLKEADEFIVKNIKVW